MQNKKIFRREYELNGKIINQRIDYYVNADPLTKALWVRDMIKKDH